MYPLWKIYSKYRAIPLENKFRDDVQSYYKDSYVKALKDMKPYAIYNDVNHSFSEILKNKIDNLGLGMRVGRFDSLLKSKRLPSRTFYLFKDYVKLKRAQFKYSQISDMLSKVETDTPFEKQNFDIQKKCERHTKETRKEIEATEKRIEAIETTLSNKEYELFQQGRIEDELQDTEWNLGDLVRMLEDYQEGWEVTFKGRIIDEYNVTKLKEEIESTKTKIKTLKDQFGHKDEREVYINKEIKNNKSEKEELQRKVTSLENKLVSLDEKSSKAGAKLDAKRCILESYKEKQRDAEYAIDSAYENVKNSQETMDYEIDSALGHFREGLGSARALWPHTERGPSNEFITYLILEYLQPEHRASHSEWEIILSKQLTAEEARVRSIRSRSRSRSRSRRRSRFFIGKDMFSSFLKLRI